MISFLINLVSFYIKHSEITFKFLVNFGKGTYASFTVNTITNDLGRSWTGVTMYINIYISSMLLLQKMMAD